MESNLTLQAPVGYQLLELLGEGGAGSVYQARQESTGQIVAVKLLRQENQADPIRRKRQADRFERETELCAQLHHAHIVRLLDKGECADGQLFAVFEYVPGETLRELLQRKGALSALVAGELMGQVLDALACAHSLGIAHRDLKPQNIMVTRTGTRANVKVLDFGIATFIPDKQKVDYRQLTMTQETMGTPSYSAPEQLRGEPPTTKSDLYAWGLLFLECLTGKPVMHGLTLAEIFHKQLNPQDVPLPPALIGHPLAELLRRVLQKSPRERPEQATALYEDFKTINLANLVGSLGESLNEESIASGQISGSQISGSHLASSQISDSNPNFAATMEYLPGTFGFAYQRAQITVLCIRLSVLALGDPKEFDQDVLEALQRDQLSLCSDIAQRYGGYLAGGLGDTQMFYFGYPHASDTDARRAARTALELASQVRRRNTLLQQNQEMSLDLGMGIHTGIVLVRAGTTPSGITPNLALQLQRIAGQGKILVSANSRRILSQFVEFDDGKVGTISSSEKQVQYFPMLGEHGTEAFSFLRNGQARSFVGRDDEMAKLRACWQDGKYAAGTALLSGQAGIGKSRMAYELCVLARQEGSVVADCRCLPEHQNNALYPVLQMLKSQLQLDQADNELEMVATLQRAVEQCNCETAVAMPILCSWFAMPLPPQFPASQLSPDRQKAALMDVLQELILRLGKDKPLLLVIEDLHWIDLTSLELINKLRVARTDLHCFLLLTTRPEFPAQINQDGLPLQHIQLQQLSHQDSASLMQSAFAGKVIEALSLQKLSARADGIPLFAEELAHMVEEKKLLLQMADGRYQLDPSFEQSDIPITLRDFLAARLTRLGSAKETAQLAAAIGREFEHTLLVQIAAADEASLQVELEQLIAADLIYRQRRVQGDSYIFRHALIRDAAYDAMPRLFREQTHARIANAMASASSAEIERNLPRLAQHYSLARLFGPAVQYGSKAANLALGRAANDDALDLTQHVEQWLKETGSNTEVEAALLNSRVQNCALMYKFGFTDPRVKESAERSLHILQTVDASSEVSLQHKLASLWSLALYHHAAGNRDVVRQLNQQLLELAGQTDEIGLAVACNTMHGTALWIDGDYTNAEPALRFAIANYDFDQHAHHGNTYGLDSRVWSMGTLANVLLFGLDDEQGAFDMAQEMVAFAQQLQHIPSLGLSWLYHALICQHMQDREQALRVCDQAISLTKKYGLPAVESYNAIVRHWALDELAEADAYCNGLKGVGCLLGLTYYYSLAAEIAARQGDMEQAVKRIDACLLLAETTSEHYYAPELLRLRAAYRPSSERELARQDLQMAIQKAKNLGMRRSVRLAQEQLASI